MERWAFISKDRLYVSGIHLNLAYPTLTKRTVLQAGRSRVRFPTGSIGVFH